MDSWPTVQNEAGARAWLGRSSIPERELGGTWQAGKTIVRELDAARARVAELEVGLVNEAARRAMIASELGGELGRVQAALRSLVDAVESPRRAIYVDEVAVARRALHMEPGLTTDRSPH